MPRRSPSIPKDKKDPTLTDMRLFHRSVDWADWWEQWFLKLDKSGRPYYRTVRQFIKEKSKGPYQYDFMDWYLGPVTNPFTGEPNVPQREEYKFVKPQDWSNRRETGGWMTDATMEQASREIRAQFDALEALKSTGHRVALPALLRYERMARMLDQRFNYGEFQPDLTDRENFARVQLYIKFMGQIEELKAQAWPMFTQSMGINFNEPSSFADLVAASTLLMQRQSSQAGGKDDRSKYQVFMNRVLEMSVRKAVEYGTPLPATIKEAAIEVTSEPVSEDDPKKVH